MPLHAQFSNRLEALFDALCAALDAQPAGPFEHDTLIVPSAALQRWLTWRLAERRGVAANLQFAYLAPWLMQRLRRPGDPEPLANAAWPWRIYQLLGHPTLRREHPRLAQALGDPQAPGAEALRWERAQHIARHLEPLGLERPDWLAAWRQRRLLLDHPDEAWQAALWRAVDDQAADLLARELPRLSDGPPERPVHLFAPARLAPLHQQALARLAECQTLHLYLLNPCREYWFDLVSPRRLARLQAQGRADAHEVLHPWLAHWAAPTQQLLRQAAELDLPADEGSYVEPPTDTLLGAVQASLLKLSALPQTAPAAHDRSLERHRCHSLRRELEVLHDRLLGLFKVDPSLRLADVLVLLPDLDAAAPLIDAVFGSAPADRHLPYTLSGQMAPALPGPVAAFLRLLALLEGPAPAAELGALFAPFALEGDEALLVDALQSAGHRAGLGQAQAAARGLSPAHTLEAALHRLVLAHCLPEHPRQPPLGPWRAAPQRLPTRELASLQTFATRLVEAEALGAQPLPPERWSAFLLRLAQDLLPQETDPDHPNAEALRTLRAAIAQLDATWREAGLTQALPLARVRAALLDTLHDPVRGGVAGGALSFSTLASLRALPARVVAVLGLNDGAWPRPRTGDPTDLLAAHPRPGDRDPRAEQRNLFLDAVLAAREHLHLSHTAFHERDGAALPASPLLTELLEALGAEVAKAITVDHPLQPFSPLAFDPTQPRRQSFRAEWRPPRTSPIAPRSDARHPGEGAADDEGEGEEGDDGLTPQPPFLTQPLPPGPVPEALSLAELLHGLRHPAQTWLQRRLGLRLPWDEAPWDEAEPFALAPLDLARWSDEALPLLASATDDDTLLRALALSDPRWPGGSLGEAAVRAEGPGLRAHARAVQAWLAAPPCDPAVQALPLRLDEHRCTLTVDTQGMRHLDGRPTRLQARYGRANAADRLLAWATHLALQAAWGPQARCLAVHRGGARTGFRAVADPLAHLQTLAPLALALAPLPPPLPLKTAWAWVEEGESAARRTWAQGLFQERHGAAWQLLRRGSSAPEPPDDPGFAEWAQAVFVPLLEHLE